MPGKGLVRRAERPWPLGAAAGGLALVIALAGCATSTEPAADAAAPNLAAERGHDLARRQCSTCHAIGQADESLWPSAPPFRSLRLRYNALSLERRLPEIAEGRHYEMPPLSLDPADVRDLSAYIESLDRN